jgi:hypothetical protein
VTHSEKFTYVIFLAGLYENVKMKKTKQNKTKQKSISSITVPANIFKNEERDHETTL